MKNIWLIRHGESSSNANLVTTHPATTTLTEKGLLQSECVATAIQEPPELIIHSPYLRARQTAYATINKFPDVMVEEWPIQEFTYLPHSAYLNTTRAERHAPVNSYWTECNPARKASPEAESFIQFMHRMQDFIERITQRKGRVLVFTHGHVIRAMIMHIITSTLEPNAHGMAKYRSLREAIEIPNCAILKIRLDQQEQHMSQLVTAHIQPESLL